MTKRSVDGFSLWCAISILVVFGTMFALAIIADLKRTEPEPDPTRIDYTLAELAQDTRNEVVRIDIGGGHGSGVVLTDYGLVLTARHVTENATDVNQIDVLFSDGVGMGVQAMVPSEEYDLAWLWLDANGLEHAELSPTDPNVGDEVYAIGSPFGFNWTVSYGHISALYRELYDLPGWEIYNDLNWVNMIQTDAMIYPGSSGGPLYNMQGEVIGIIVAGRDSGLAFSVPLECILEEYLIFEEIPEEPIDE